MKNNKSLVKNFSLNLIKTFMSIVFPLITFPYASRVLGAEGIGKVQFAESITNYFVLLAGLGINAYGIREAAKYKNNRSALESFSGELFTINIFSTIVAYIIYYIIFFTFGYLKEYRVLISIQMLVILFSLFGLDWLFIAIEEYQYITVRAIAFQTISLVSMLLFVKKHEDYIWYCVILVFASVGSNILNFFYSKKFIQLKIIFSAKLFRHFRPIMYIFGTNIASTIYLSLDKTIIGLYMNDFAVGLYTGSTKIVNAFSMLLKSIANVILPRISYYFGKNLWLEYNKLLYMGCNYTLMFAIPLAFGIIILGKEILLIFCGAEYESAYWTLCVLSVNMIVSVFNNILAWIILIPQKMENKVLVGTLLGAVSNFILNIFIIKKYGILGAAFTTFVSEGFVFLYCILQIRKKVKIREGIKYVPQYIFASFSFLLIKKMIYKYVRESIVEIILQIVLSVIMYFIVLFFFKNQYVEQIKQKVFQVIRKGDDL